MVKLNKYRGNMMAVLGIDLGTSNSLVGYFDGEKAQLIPNAFEEHLTPSVIHVDDSGIIEVGKIAKQRLVTHPSQTVSVFKRTMGTNKTYQLGKEHYTSIDLSALVLKQLKEDAEVYLKEECNEAVISVPAYFNNKQRQATIDAARIAGLHVLRLISEPTAAALAHGITDFVDDSIIIVLDLGGGTFDVSILEMFDGILQVLAIAGDNMLGGEDFTHVIVEDFCQQQNIDYQSLSTQDQSIIYDQCEQIKRDIENRSVFNIVYSNQTAEYELDENRYNELCKELFQRLRYPIIKALNDASIKTDKLTEVILMGGSTKLSIFKDYVRILFNKQPKMDLNPDETVAIGSVLSTALIQETAFEEMMMTDVCGFTLGVETSKREGIYYSQGHFSPIIHRNATLPVSRIESYYSVDPNQTKIQLNVYQGESKKVEDNIKLGSMTVELPRKGANQAIEVRFTYDMNGILEVEVTVMQTKEISKIVITDDACALTPVEIEQKLKSYQKLKVHPKENQEYRLTKAKLDRLYEITHGYLKDQIEQAIVHLELVAEKQNEIETKKTIKEMNRFMRQVEEELNKVFVVNESETMH